MKFVVKLFLTSIIGTLAFIGAMGAANPLPAFTVGFGVWILFIWSLSADTAKRHEKLERKELIEELMCDWERSRRR